MKKIFLLILILSLSNLSFSQVETEESNNSNTLEFKKLDEAPDFSGGDAARIKYIRNNLNYPQEAWKNKIQGPVYLRFVIEKDGSITNVEVIKGIGFGCDEEASRLVESMPNWIPGKAKGKILRSQFYMPIRFSIDNFVFDNSDVDSPALFSKDNSAFDLYLMENFKYPRKFIKNGLEGDVQINFTVFDNGSIANLKVAESFNTKIEKKVLKFISEMPNWNAAYHYKSNVDVKVDMLFKFRIKNEKADINVFFDDEIFQIYDNSDDSIYTVVDKDPEFKNGKMAMLRFFQENVSYPAEAKNNKVQATVFLTYVIEKDGSISNIEVVKGVDKSLNEEAIRVINSMPYWKPARKDGKIVRFRMNQPIKFTLN